MSKVMKKEKKDPRVSQVVKLIKDNILVVNVVKSQHAKILPHLHEEVNRHLWSIRHMTACHAALIICKNLDSSIVSKIESLIEKYFILGYEIDNLEDGVKWILTMYDGLSKSGSSVEFKFNNQLRGS